MLSPLIPISTIQSNYVSFSVPTKSLNNLSFSVWVSTYYLITLTLYWWKVYGNSKSTRKLKLFQNRTWEALFACIGVAFSEEVGDICGVVGQVDQPPLNQRQDTGSTTEWFLGIIVLLGKGVGFSRELCELFPFSPWLLICQEICL